MSFSVRYATTEDDVRIAYTSEGDGPVCVHMPLVPWTTMTMMSELDARPARGRAPTNHTGLEIVRYDVRGTGLSDGETRDLGLDAQLLDLAAVVDHLAADQVALLAPAHSGPAAIAYAAQHPERVSHLILWRAYARGADFFERDRLRALRDTLSADWQLFTEYLALEIIGWDDGGAAESVATLVQRSIGPGAAAEALETLSALDVTSMLPSVRAPTLVLQRRKPATDPLIRVARTVASRIPNARLVYMDESALAPELVMGSGAARQLIEEFLGEAPATSAASPTDVDVLTSREKEVLQLLANDHTNTEIADALVLSVRTVERHLGNIYGKFDVRGRAAAVAVALRSGID